MPATGVQKLAVQLLVVFYTAIMFSGLFGVHVHFVELEAGPTAPSITIMGTGGHDDFDHDGAPVQEKTLFNYLFSLGLLMTGTVLILFRSLLLKVVSIVRPTHHCIWKRKPCRPMVPFFIASRAGIPLLSVRPPN